MTYSNWQLIKDLLSFIKPYRKRFILGTFIRLSSDLVWLFPAWGISEIINFAISHEPGEPITFFWIMTGLIIGVAIYHVVAQDLAKYFIYPVAEQVALDSKIKTIEHLFKLDSDYHEKENTGNKIKRTNSAAEACNKLIRMYVDLIIESTVNAIGICIILSTLGPLFTGVLIFFFLTYLYLSVRLTRRASEQSRIVHRQEEQLEGTSFEAVNNIATVKALHLAPVLLSRIRQQMKSLFVDIRKRVLLFRVRTGFLNFYREVFRQSLILLVALQIFSGQVEVGMLTLVLQYFIKISTSSEELAEVAHEFVQAKIAISRREDILKTPPTAETSGTKVFPKNWKKLVLKDLTFAYQGRPVLKNFSLTISRGEKIGIVGLSGAGKSTLFKLLLKLYDRYEGHILFDEIELRDIRRNTYIPHIAYVPQETELFNLSLKENIALDSSSRAFDLKKIDKAVRIAHVEDFLEKLPQGLDTLVGEKGVKLSGGEKQRVGIARAIYREPDLLLMDEATSHLDAESERKIQDTLHEIFKDITAVVIAHRLSTLKEMDRILVLGQGKIIEDGHFKTLDAKGGVFSKLLAKQKF